MATFVPESVSLSQNAEQGARANVLRCHAACFVTTIGDEASDCESSCGTRRASEGRGSSVTLGLSAPIWQLKSMALSVRIREVLVAAQRPG